MNCKFQPTAESHRSGRPIVRCDRAGCDNHGLMPLSSDPARLVDKCHGAPHWHEWGHWMALVLAVIGVTNRRYGYLAHRQNGCATCDQREQSLNTTGQRFAATMQSLYETISNLCKIRR